MKLLDANDDGKISEEDFMNWFMMKAPSTNFISIGDVVSRIQIIESVKKKQNITFLEIQYLHSMLQRATSCEWIAVPSLSSYVSRCCYWNPQI